MAGARLFPATRHEARRGPETSPLPYARPFEVTRGPLAKLRQEASKWDKTGSYQRPLGCRAAYQSGLLSRQ